MRRRSDDNHALAVRSLHQKGEPGEPAHVKNLELSFQNLAVAVKKKLLPGEFTGVTRLVVL